jgi:hypothetical protein
MGRIKRVIDITSTSKCTHKKYLEYRREFVFKDPMWNKLTIKNRYFCDGYFEALHDIMIRDNVKWYHFWEENGERKFARKWEEIPEHLREPANNGKRLFESGFFWEDTDKLWA